VSGEYTVGVPGWFACAWNTLRSRPNVVLRGLAIMLLFSLAVILIGLLPGGYYAALAVQLTIGLVLQAGWNLFCLKLVREEEPSPAVIFEPFARFGQVWLVSILISLMTAAGLFFFIIPGLYVWARFGMGIFAMVDRKMAVADALDFSSQITEGSRLQILLLHLIIAALTFLFLAPALVESGGQLGTLMLLAYQFVMIPLAGTAYAAAYDSLVETRTGGEE
jgi:hypothetical protein